MFMIILCQEFLKDAFYFEFILSIRLYNEFHLAISHEIMSPLVYLTDEYRLLLLVDIKLTSTTSSAMEIFLFLIQKYACLDSIFQSNTYNFTKFLRILLNSCCSKNVSISILSCKPKQKNRFSYSII